VPRWCGCRLKVKLAVACAIGLLERLAAIQRGGHTVHHLDREISSEHQAALMKIQSAISLKGHLPAGAWRSLFDRQKADRRPSLRTPCHCLRKALGLGEPSAIGCVFWERCGTSKRSVLHKEGN
jgi:hypothetical protein